MPGDIELGEVWFCEGPAARRPVLEPTPTPERPVGDVVRQQKVWVAGPKRNVLLAISRVNVACRSPPGRSRPASDLRGFRL